MPSSKTKDESAGPDSSLHLFRWLWKNYLKKHIRLLIVATFLMAIEGSMLALLARMVVPMFEDVFAGQSTTALYGVGLAVMGIFIFRALASAAQKILLAYIKQLAATDMRRDLLSHLMILDSSFYQVHPPGQLISRVQGDVGSINSVWSSLLTAMGRDLVSLFGLMAVAIWIDWQWTLMAIIGIPLLVMPSLMVQTYIRRSSRRVREIAGRISTRLDEVFHGINPIKLNSLERYQAKRYDGLLQKSITANVKMAAGQAAVPSLIDIMTGIGFFGVLLYGGSEIIAGEKTVAHFMGFFTAIGLAFDPLRRIGAMSGKWQMAAASVERLLFVMNKRPSITSPAQPKRIDDQTPSVIFENVSLSYGELPVLRNTSFLAEAGKTTALVGASGAGKSTIFNVLTRIVDPQEGSVRVGETPITDLELDELRGQFSVVSQDAALFDESLRDNILLGRTDVSEEQLKSVLDAAHVTDFLEQMPDGLDSPAGPRGSALSGGQRQRIAIARALLRNTPILLLDEATSALDTKSEAIVQAALDELSTGRTTLVIAHRLSTVRNAHSIIVMDQGRAVDQGTHDELLARGGIYADLHRLQFSQSESE